LLDFVRELGWVGWVRRLIWNADVGSPPVEPVLRIGMSKRRPQGSPYMLRWVIQLIRRLS
jgi:hypothetical protein